MPVSDHETGSPQSRLAGVRKQLRLALQDVDDPTAAARIQDARRAARRASDELASVPIMVDPIPVDTSESEEVEE
jgi:hypothetical protein